MDFKDFVRSPRIFNPGYLVPRVRIFQILEIFKIFRFLRIQKIYEIVKESAKNFSSNLYLFMA